MTSVTLVTGGVDHIGNHVCKALASARFVSANYDTLSRRQNLVGQYRAILYSKIYQMSRRGMSRTFRLPGEGKR